MSEKVMVEIYLAKVLSPLSGGLNAENTSNFDMYLRFKASVNTVGFVRVFYEQAYFRI